MKRTIALALAVAMLALPSCSGSAGKGGEAVLKAVTYAPPNSTADDMEIFRRYAEKVKEASDGALTIDIIGGPDVVPTDQQIDAVSRGSLADMVMTFGVHQDRVPIVETAGLSEITPAEERKNGYFDLLVEENEKKLGITPLGRTATNSGFFIFSRKPIRKLSDFKDLRIRSHSGYDPFFKALGAKTSDIDISEIYGALDRGIVDAAPYPLYVSDLGLPEVAGYALETDFWPAHTTYSYVNTKVFEGLSKDHQKILTETAQKLEQEMPKIVQKLAATERGKLEKAGVEFTSMSESDAKEYLRISRDSKWASFLSTKALTSEEVEKIQGMISK